MMIAIRVDFLLCHAATLQTQLSLGERQYTGTQGEHVLKVERRQQHLEEYRPERIAWSIRMFCMTGGILTSRMGSMHK